MDLVFGYLAGLLTLINPCVLPVLPLVLAGALQANRWGPVALAGGMGVSFVALGLTVAAAGRSLGLTEDTMARAGAAAMLAFGIVLLVPRLQAGFALATGGMAARADRGVDAVGRGLGGQVAAGALLGAVWSPCIGPTLGGAIALASQGGSLWAAGAVMVAFAAGVATLILAIGYGARAWIARNRGAMQRLATRARPVMGIAFAAVGLLILTGG
ncbi:MAG: cytochrome c biogenesis CcdA family protein, partial [Gemmobacter sp.]